MSGRLSLRLAAVVDALPLAEGLRVLEIGCGSGAAAREVARRVGAGHVLGIDRSATAIEQAVAGSADMVAEGGLSFRCSAVEHFELGEEEARFDLAFAVRVGALDGRHPGLERDALSRIAAALVPKGRLFIDTGYPMREVRLPGR